MTTFEINTTDNPRIILTKPWGMTTSLCPEAGMWLYERGFYRFVPSLNQCWEDNIYYKVTFENSPRSRQRFGMDSEYNVTFEFPEGNDSLCLEFLLVFSGG